MSGVGAKTGPWVPNSQLSRDAVLDELLAETRQLLGVDTAAILLLDASRQFLVATAALGIEDEVREGSRVRAGLGFAGRVAAEARPVILDRVTPRNVVNPILLRRGITSMLGVPLLAAGDHGEPADVLGVLHVGSLTARRFTPAEVAQLEHAARRVAEAIEVHRKVVDRAAAAALQASLASRLPDVPGLDMAARYVPGGQYGIGGDWYDVFLLPSGLIGITIGDVMGHGLHAATVMGRVRSALRAYALEHTDPAVVLDRLDRKMRHFEPGLIGTVGYAVLDPVTRLMTISSAGHLPPVLLVPTQAGRLLELPVDPPIGVESPRPRRALDVPLDPGSLLCFYTDGLVERRTSDLSEQLDVLCDVVTTAPRESTEQLCAEIMSAMLHDRMPEDDVSVLALHIDRPYPVG